MGIKEEWRTIENYPEYQISSFGRVKSLLFGKERILKQGKDENGYLQVVLTKDKKQKTFRVHRLVCSAFIPNPQNLPCVNHKDEQKTNNCVDNLEWCSYTYNINYGTRNDKCAKAHKGMKHTQETKDKICKAQSKPILQFSKSGNIILHKWDSISQASEILGIDNSSISKSCKGKQKTCGGYRWMYIEDYVNRMEKLYNLALKNVS